MAPGQSSLYVGLRLALRGDLPILHYLSHYHQCSQQAYQGPPCGVASHPAFVQALGDGWGQAVWDSLVHSS